MSTFGDKSNSSNKEGYCHMEAMKCKDQLSIYCYLH